MAIELKNVSYKYKKINYSSNLVLNNINMKFMDGKITSIIGSYKSTLLEIIFGEIIDFSGELIRDTNKIGYVSQNIYDNYVCDIVYEEMLNNFDLEKTNIDNCHKKILNSLIMVELDSTYLKRRINTLSSSELRKLNLAIALLNNPKVVILDEANADLDDKALKNLIKIIRILKNRYHKTIIVASNDIEFIHQISDYIYVLDNNKVILEGKKYDVFKKVDILKKSHIKIPNVMLFSYLTFKQKKIKLGYRDDINDLIKDIYRNIK